MFILKICKKKSDSIFLFLFQTAQDISFSNVLALFQSLANRGSNPPACQKAGQEGPSQTCEVQSTSSASHSKELQTHHHCSAGGISEECQPHLETKEKAVHYGKSGLNWWCVQLLFISSVTLLTYLLNHSSYTLSECVLFDYFCFYILCSSVNNAHIRWKLCSNVFNYLLFKCLKKGITCGG